MIRGQKANEPLLQRMNRYIANRPCPVKELKGECWIWTSSTRGNWCVYGAVTVKGKSQSTHRVMYELFVGRIPKGKVLDHLCGVTLCCNPKHLRPASNKDNILRGNSPFARNKRKTHCVRGHEFTPENTRIERGVRICRRCHMNRMALWNKEHPKRYERYKHGSRIEG